MYPVFGPDAFRTATRVHAAAVIKAKNKGDAWLADRVYSGVPAGWFGLKQNIQIGSKSGVANIVYWLAEHGVKPDKQLVDQIFTAAKQHDKVLTDDEVWNIIKVYDYASHSMMTDTFDEWNRQIRAQGI
jgi:2-isopropylmalate synthase